MTLILTSTYRLQVHKDFPLAKVREVVPYLRELGISHLYFSPILAARPGSTHGYDVVDPARVNPEIGTEEELRALAGEVHAAGMGIVLDIVPNHMGVGSDNPYWEDVLTHGRQSRYAKWFDIDWDAHSKRRGKVVLPVLGDELAAVLDKGELGLDISESGGVRLKYHESTFPVDPSTVPPELQLVQFDPNAKPAAEEWVRGEDGESRIRAMLDEQHYKLAFWRCAPSDINYRRFFDINDLAAVRAEDPEVFAETHAKILEWVEEGVIDGLRIDHVDGLKDPLGYLQRLSQEVEGRRSKVLGNRSPPRTSDLGPRTSDFPIFVEKILSPGEHLRREWPVQGTTGYETLNDIESILIDNQGALTAEQMYRRMRRLTGRDREVTFEDVARDGKMKVLRGALRADMKRLARLLVRAQPERKGSDERSLVNGIIQLVAALPVYRTYIDGRHSLPYREDREVIERAVAIAQEHAGEAELEVVRDLAKVFLEPLDAESGKRLDFVFKFQQTSGPATAKGVEDTALYNYFPLASRNEVGGEPDRPLHDAVERFHTANAERARDWPLALVATNTHDTKRSADLRARIDVLSEVPHEWERHLVRWRRLNKRLKTSVKGRPSPDTNTEYLLYQTLVGLWPTPRANRRADDLPDDAWFAGAAERLERYMMKAIKEAKTHTSWTDSDEEYEQSVKRFVHAILDTRADSPFLHDIARFVHAIARAGLWNSLARVLLHYTVPGTPDTYQGDELWAYMLVDPDNRQPVNYEHRLAYLAELTLRDKQADGRNGIVRELARTPEDPRLKLLIVRQLLHTRRAMPQLFTEGDYIPLSATGSCADHVFAFARRKGASAAVTVVPRQTMTLLRGERTQATGDAWGDTRIVLPNDLTAVTWRSALTGREVHVERDGSGRKLRLSELFADLAVDLLLSGGP